MFIVTEYAALRSALFAESKSIFRERYTIFFLEVGGGGGGDYNLWHLQYTQWTILTKFYQTFMEKPIVYKGLALNAPIATKVVCFSGLLKCLRSLYGKQCGPRSDLFWVHPVCFYT